MAKRTSRITFRVMNPLLCGLVLVVGCSSKQSTSSTTPTPSGTSTAAAPQPVAVGRVLRSGSVNAPLHVFLPKLSPGATAPSMQRAKFVDLDAAQAQDTQTAATDFMLLFDVRSTSAGFSDGRGVRAGINPVAYAQCAQLLAGPKGGNLEVMSNLPTQYVCTRTSDGHIAQYRVGSATEKTQVDPSTGAETDDVNAVIEYTIWTTEP